LEAIHDKIHGSIGGHMGDHAVAGKFSVLTLVMQVFLTCLLSVFDFMFFLHHANLDRLFTCWSALHPNTWATEGLAKGGTSVDSSSSSMSIAFDLGLLLKLLTRFRPYAFQENADDSLGFIGNYDDPNTSILVPGIQ
jgi:hypothetical protein